MRSTLILRNPVNAESDKHIRKLIEDGRITSIIAVAAVGQVDVDVFDKVKAKYPGMRVIPMLNVSPALGFDVQVIPFLQKHAVEGGEKAVFLRMIGFDGSLEDSPKQVQARMNELKAFVSEREQKYAQLPGSTAQIEDIDRCSIVIIGGRTMYGLSLSDKIKISVARPTRIDLPSYGHLSDVKYIVGFFEGQTFGVYRNALVKHCIATGQMLIAYPFDMMSIEDIRSVFYQEEKPIVYTKFRAVESVVIRELPMSNSDVLLAEGIVPGAIVTVSEIHKSTDATWGFVHQSAETKGIAGWVALSIKDRNLLEEE